MYTKLFGTIGVEMCMLDQVQFAVTLASHTGKIKIELQATSAASRRQQARVLYSNLIFMLWYFIFCPNKNITSIYF
jgi:hypothetical protein